MHKSVVGKMPVWTLFLVRSGMFVLFSQEVRLQIFSVNGAQRKPAIKIKI